MWETITTALHLSRQTFHLMEETSVIMNQLEDFVMGSLPQTSLVKFMNKPLRVQPNIRFYNEVMYNFLSVTAEYLGFTSYPPAYLSQEAIGMNILTGVNFASAASGYYNWTAWSWVNIGIPIFLICFSFRHTRLHLSTGFVGCNFTGPTTELLQRISK